MTRVATRARIPSLDGLRAVSIAMVVVGHTAATISLDARWRIPLLIAGNGHTGVSIFFVISGFLITGLLIAEESSTGKISLRHFYVRRAFRILPALFTFLGTIGLLDLLGQMHVPASDLLKAAFFIWNYVPGNSWFVGHTWSLSIEEQFYLVWPVVFCLAAARSRIPIAVSIIAASPLIRVVAYMEIAAWRGRIPIMTHTRADMLMFGCLLAFIYQSGRFARLIEHIEKYHLNVAAFIFLFFLDPFLVASLRGSYELTAGYTLEGLSITIIVAYAITHPKRGITRLLNINAVMFVGTISYSLYLWQQLFLTPLNTSFTGRFPFSLFFAFCAAVISYYAIEQPMLALRKWLTQRWNTRPIPAVSKRPQPVVAVGASE